MAKSILVIDDDPIVRHWLRETLQKAGYEVIEGAEGNAALSLVRDRQPDLLLLDVEMPGMGGHEICRIIKGNKAFGFLPIILMTAREDVQTKVEGLELGADDYLVKPLNPLELEARVKSMIRLKELQDELIKANQRLKSMNEKLQELSTVDALMGIANRMSFNKRIAYEFQRADRYRKPLALLVMDLDHFKQINDSHGHPFGDRVLQVIAGVLRDSIRQVDILARYGGEELVIALPETDKQPALLVAERIRRNVERAVIEEGPLRARVTISIGLALCPHPSVRSVEELLKKADEALYLAKQAGRNRVCLADYLDLESG